MQRRTFLRCSGFGIGTLAGMYTGDLRTEGAIRNPQPALTAQSTADGLATTNLERQLAWGINAVVLKSPWSSSPSLDELLADRDHTLVLSRFYRAGGENRPASPTECRIAYDSDALLVVFRCEENDLSFPLVCKRRIGIRCMVYPADQIPGLPFQMKWTFSFSLTWAFPPITNSQRHRRA